VTASAERGCLPAKYLSPHIGILTMASALIGLLLCCDCGSREPTCTTCPPSSLAPEPTCYAPPTKDVPHNTMPPNGLIPAATGGSPPNLALLDKLANSALKPTLFTGDTYANWQTLLKEGTAPELIKYALSCALDSDQVVNLPAWPEFEYLGAERTCGFRGEVGLCKTWVDEPATEACLERVSACVLARVNALYLRVPISLRGEGTKLLDQVPVQTQFRENRGTPIQSFKRCDRMCLWGDRLRRNCDWEPRLVGQCTRDGEGPRTVKLKLSTDAKGPVRVRICRGIYGCDDTNPDLGAGASTQSVYANGRLVDFPTYYGGHMIYQGAAANGDTIAFGCPDDGPLVDVTGSRVRTGYYSVMLGALEPGASLSTTTAVTLPDTGKHDAYPAPENNVFTYREGGFFGTIFPGKPEAKPVNNKFACASSIWDVARATGAGRICAGELGAVLPGGCFGNRPGECDVPVADGHCDASAPPKVYEQCWNPPRGPGDEPPREPWKHPYTPYLNHPCDMFASDNECGEHLSPELKEDVKLRAMPNRTPKGAARIN
jgi:hypothetical protein